MTQRIHAQLFTQTDENRCPQRGLYWVAMAMSFIIANNWEQPCVHQPENR